MRALHATCFLLFAFLLAGLPTGCSRSGGTGLSNAIAEHFVTAMRERGYPFLSNDKLASLKTEIADFAASFLAGKMPTQEREALLASVDRYVPEYFGNQDTEGAYLKFRDSVSTFKWKLWRTLTRKPLAAEDTRRRDAQHEWLRQFIAGVRGRPGDGTPLGVPPTEAGVRSWASSYVDRQCSDPLSVLSDPMTDSQFEVFKQWMIRSSANGLYDTTTDIPCRALGAVAHEGTGADEAYASPIQVQLPFRDEIVEIWGGGGGAGPHFAFASNRQFRGQDVFLQIRGFGVFDIVQGPCRTPLMEEQNASASALATWAQEHSQGDIAYDDSVAALIAVRGARLVELDVLDWFQADRVNNADLRKVVDERGSASLSVAKLPPINGRRKVGVTDPRCFIVIRSAEGRLAVADVRSREFGQLNMVSRLRSEDPSRPASSDRAK
jgi:hypothetical protein